MSYYTIRLKDSLRHYGTEGMHWGVRNGPPYPLHKNSGSANLSSRKIKFRVPKMSLENRRWAEQLWAKNKGIIPDFNSKSAVLSMFTNTLTAEEKEEPIVRGFLGDYLYTGINRGYEEYKIIGEERIGKPPGRPKDEEDDTLGNMFGWDWPEIWKEIENE